MATRMNDDAARDAFQAQGRGKAQAGHRSENDLEEEAGVTPASGDEGATSAEDASEVEEPRIVTEAEAVIEGAMEGDELEEARKEAADWQDRYMRLHAEWDTYRRRITEQRAEEKARAAENLIEDLIPVLDDFERSITYAEENGEAGLLDGVKAVQSKFIGALTKDGLQVIDPVDQPYDALEAQAVSTIPDPEAYDETVRDVFQKGYKLGNKVIRPAMVTVTTGGPKRPKDEEEE